MKDNQQRKGFHEIFAEKVIAQLEAGTAPWQKPWHPGKTLMIPHNPQGGTIYKGMNRINLTLAMIEKGYEDPRWMTLKQANEMGLRIKKGSQAEVVVYYQFTKEQDRLDENGKPVLGPDGSPEREVVRLQRPIMRGAHVFNGTQIEGMPPIQLTDKAYAWNPEEKAERILSASGANIRHDQSDRAFYRYADDSVHLPPRENFEGPGQYYGTALHELGHWTRHETRLNRENGPFGSELYAREELRAEIASWMLGEEIGIPHDPGQHASYVASWITALREDPYEIVRACRDAERIKEMLLGYELKQEQHQEQGVAMGEGKDKAVSLDAEHAPSVNAAPAASKTWLCVPYAEKDQARLAGARWDRHEKLWFAPTGADLTPLERWMPQPGQEQTPTPAMPPQAEFAEALRAIGIDLKGEMPTMDGTIHRVGTADRPHSSNGAYLGYSDGTPNGWGQNFRTGERIEWVATGCRLSEEQLQAMRAEAAQKKERDAAERAQRNEQAAKRAFGIWKNAPGWAESDHPYFQKKGVRGYGVKIGESGTLLIPGRDVDGHIHTLQVITPEGEKRFLSGSRKHGTLHLIDPDRQMGKAPILVAEGYATAATAHEAVKLPVAVAFDSGNLLPVAQALSAKYPDLPVVVLTDDDHKQPNNPGLRYGMMVAEVLGGFCAAPALNDEEKEKGLTDWNDLAASRGIEAVRDQLAPVLKKCMARQQAQGMER